MGQICRRKCFILSVVYFNVEFTLQFVLVLVEVGRRSNKTSSSCGSSRIVMVHNSLCRFMMTEKLA